MESSPDRKFFDLAYQNFLLASSKVGTVRLYYRLIGKTFCLQFAGNAMIAPLVSALEHLRVEESSPNLTICIWDQFSTGAPLLKLPWESLCEKPRGEVEGFSSDEVYIVKDIHTKVLNLLNHKKNTALYWIEDWRKLPWWIGGAPLQLILHWWMRGENYQLTHAAAVGYPEGGALLAGKSGSGKSTTTLACMKWGMRYVSEDYCFLSSAPNTWAYSVYNSSKLEQKTLDFFPELEKHIVNVDRKEGEKAFLYHFQFQPEKMLKGFLIKALICLKIDKIKTSFLKQINPKEAVASLALTTLWQLTHTGPVVFSHLRQVAESLPCYELYLGEDFMQAPRLIEKVL